MAPPKKYPDELRADGELLLHVGDRVGLPPVPGALARRPRTSCSAISTGSTTPSASRRISAGSARTSTKPLGTPLRPSQLPSRRHRPHPGDNRLGLSGEAHHRLAFDAGVSQATGYRYLHEGIDVLAELAPELHEVLDRRHGEGMTHVVLDGTLASCDRLAGVTENGNDLWYSVKGRRFAGNIQFVSTRTAPRYGCPMGSPAPLR